MFHMLGIVSQPSVTPRIVKFAVVPSGATDVGGHIQMLPPFSFLFAVCRCVTDGELLAVGDISLNHEYVA